MNDEHDKDELAQTEEFLGQLTPAPVNVDRERLMFLAGQAAAEVSRLSLPSQRTFGRAKGDYLRFLWPAVSACLAIALTVQLMQPPRERIVVRDVVVSPTGPIVADASKSPLPPSPTTSPKPRMVAQAVRQSPADLQRDATPSVSLNLPTASVFQMRNVALRFGVDALPAAPTSSPTHISTPSPLGRWQELKRGELSVRPEL